MLNNDLKNSPFYTPQSYFDELPSKVQDRCIAARKSPRSGLVPKFAFAGGVAALVLSLFFSDVNNTSELNDPNIQTAATEIHPKITDPKSLLENYINASEKFKSDAVIDYLTLRNVNVDDILLAKSTRY